MKKYTNLWLTGSFLFVLLFSMNLAYADKVYRVRSADHLDRIVKKYYPSSHLSKAQIMVGILAKNPKAFKGGNINFLLRGKKLILPDESKLGDISNEDAKQLLSQHAKFFRRGVTGDLSSFDLNKKDQNPKDLVETQQEQTDKIGQLEQESIALKKKLEELLEEKKASDKKLLELENAIKETRSSSGLSNNEKKNSDLLLEQKTKQQEQTNSRLQQQLQESRAEPKISDVKQNGNTGSEQPVKTTEKATTGDAGSSYSSYLKWIIPLLALMALWFLLRSVLKSRKKNNKVAESYSESIGSLGAFEENEDIDSDYEEESLETSIKLDVVRAYVEAGDTESALDILNEVMEEGSKEQKQEAEEILAIIRSK